MDTIDRPDEEWRKLLTPEQYKVLRKEGTERAGTSPLNQEKRNGRYLCAGCGAPLFASDTKFESGTGWPSFWAPASSNSLKVKSDNSFGMSRDELVCAKCGGHLGHVFNDGPAPTGQRYCMDSDGMVFEKK